SGRSGHELSASNKSKSSTDGSSATRRAFKTGHASGYSSSDRLATTTNHTNVRSSSDDNPTTNTTSRSSASSSSFSGGVTRPNELHESGHSSGHSEDQLTIANTSCVSKDHAYGRSSGDDKPALKKASSSSFSGGVTRPNELHKSGQSFGHSEDQLTVANTSCVSKDHAYDRSNGDDTPAAKKASSSSFSGDVTRPPELHKSGHSSSQSDDKFTVINTSSVSKDRENGRSSGERTIINASSCSGGTVQPHKPHSSKRASDHRGSASNPSSSSGVD
ncbi:AAEL003904-PA, partial [Aedes aegypti]